MSFLSTRNGINDHDHYDDNHLSIMNLIDHSNGVFSRVQKDPG